MPPSPDLDAWPFASPAAATGTTVGGEPADSLAACYGRVFAGADGRRVLAHLRALTLDRALGPEASETALRHLEGQRALVALILGLVARAAPQP